MDMSLTDALNRLPARDVNSLHQSRADVAREVRRYLINYGAAFIIHMPATAWFRDEWFVPDPMNMVVNRNENGSRSYEYVIPLNAPQSDTVGPVMDGSRIRFEVAEVYHILLKGTHEQRQRQVEEAAADQKTAG